MMRISGSCIIIITEFCQNGSRTDPSKDSFHCIVCLQLLTYTTQHYYIPTTLLTYVVQVKFNSFYGSSKYVYIPTTPLDLPPCYWSSKKVYIIIHIQPTTTLLNSKSQNRASFGFPLLTSYYILVAAAIDGGRSPPVLWDVDDHGRGSQAGGGPGRTRPGLLYYSMSLLSPTGDKHQLHISRRVAQRQTFQTVAAADSECCGAGVCPGYTLVIVVIFIYLVFCVWFFCGELSS